MFSKLEAIGSRLLTRLVPGTEASAATTACGWKYFPQCMECNYGPCRGYCCDGSGCSEVRCS
ncbi:hypothetical protein ACFVWY_33255 [Streptomyces sp. NPDC058195]|uniref:hypothetical protein n=1 Tax=Streptomyces sp. NPDC058195 TaxID=3346375 RepID=UPI0036EE1C71